MNFVSAPIRKAMQASLAGKQVDPVEIAYRQDEKYWVMMPLKNEISVYFSVNYTNTTDISLARVMMLEW